jgi:hypothetical protein
MRFASPRVRRKEFLPLGILLVFGQFIYSQARVVRLLNWIVAALTDLNRGKFVLVLPPRINRKNLILLVLIEAQVPVILNRAVLLFQSTQISPPISDASSFMNNMPAASRRSGRGYSLPRMNAPGNSARSEIIRRGVPSGSTKLIRCTAIWSNVALREAANHRDRKNKSNRSRIDSQKPLAGKQFHNNLPRYCASAFYTQIQAEKRARKNSEIR